MHPVFDDLAAAREYLDLDGGVLLVLPGGRYVVVPTLGDAYDMRSGSFVSDFDEAKYWAMLGASEFDETDPRMESLNH